MLFKLDVVRIVRYCVIGVDKYVYNRRGKFCLFYYIKCIMVKNKVGN